MSSRVVFQVVDGGILRHIQLEKTSPAYNCIMAVFDAEHQAQRRNRVQTTMNHFDNPSNPPAGRQEQPPLELDDGSSPDASLSSCNVSDTTAMANDEDEQLKRTPKQRKMKQNNCFTCVECGYVSRDTDRLRRHLRTHTNEKPCKCRVCGKAFSQDGNRRVHERTHTGEKPYTCRMCGKAFAQFDTCCKHERTHTGEKPYECVVCGKTFSQNSHRQRHIRSHTGEKPYACVVCGKALVKTAPAESMSAPTRRHNTQLHAHPGKRSRQRPCHVTRWRNEDVYPGNKHRYFQTSVTPTAIRSTIYSFSALRAT